MQRWKLGVAALTVFSLMSACSFSFSVGDSDLDLDKLKDNVSTEFEAQTGEPVSSVDCPESVKQEEGNDFECTVNLESGGSVTISVVQTDDDGNVEWEVIQ